jgi:hypothetical protein
MKTFKLLVNATVLLISVFLFSLNPNLAIAQSEAGKHTTYLPVVKYNAYSGFSTTSKFLGIYMQHYWTDAAVDTYMPIADNLSEKKHSVTGWFINLQNIAFTSRQNDNRTNNFYRQLEALWHNGYISFVNLGSASQSTAYDVTDNCPIPFSAYQVASGECDRAIQKLADLYSQWVSLGSGRRAFLAPLQEMNGVNADGTPWTPYGGNPDNFKLAYQRILDIFTQKGVTRDQVWWVFAPNGWSKAGHEFEKYYPGDAVTDVVAFSSYNYGYCSAALPWPKWENYPTLFTPYLARIFYMSPNKPVILGQTGSTAEYQYTGEFNVTAKNTWMQVNYEYLSNQPQVIGILYYDHDLSGWECNWMITNGTTFKPGYQAGASYPAFQYLDWRQLLSIIP